MADAFAADVQFLANCIIRGTYLYGRPFPPHAHLPISKEHFETWLEIFTNTLDELFEGNISEEAKWRATQMAKMFLNKIEYFKDYTGETLL